MPKQRDAIRMSEAEVAAFLDAAQTISVATIGKDGAPHLTALWFARDGDTILFETYGRSQKVVNLRRDPRIAVLAEAGTSYPQLHGVSINGHAEVVDAEPRLSALMRKIIGRTGGPSDDASLDEHVAAMVRKRVVIVVHPEKTISWDHRKLAPS
jgi:PPOX class probable F420-dependent enzyme